MKNKVATTFATFALYSVLTAICAQSTMAVGNQLAVELRTLVRK